VQDNISYISEYLEDNLSMFDFGLTGQLSELYYGINFIKKVLEEIKDIQSGRFSLYPLHSVESTEEIEYEEEGLWDETEGVSDDSADEWGTEAETPDSYGTEAELETPENVEGGMGTGTPGVEVVKEADQATQASQASTTGAKGSLPEDFWNFFGNMPALYNDIVDELEINFPAISEVKDFLFSDLAYLHKWISVLKMLNIKIPLNADQILTKTETFRMKKGFAKPNLRGERKYPDPVNTFYGLAIYSEFDILDRLDLKAIHEYLLDEANNINEYSILTNYSIFLSLRILDRNGFPMGDFSYLIPRVMSIDYEKRKDQYDALEDMIYLMTFIQTIDPDYDFSELSSNYHMEVQVALNDDGSINRKLTDTAKSFIVMNQLNMQNTAEAKFALKYIQYDTSYFNDIVKEEPLGWNKDELGYVIELNILYWGLLALTTMYPSLPSVQKAVICPNCNKFFHQKPKFCNKCGHQL